MKNSLGCGNFHKYMNLITNTVLVTPKSCVHYKFYYSTKPKFFLRNLTNELTSKEIEIAIGIYFLWQPNELLSICVINHLHHMRIYGGLICYVDEPLDQLRLPY